MWSEECAITTIRISRWRVGCPGPSLAAKTWWPTCRGQPLTLVERLPLRARQKVAGASVARRIAVLIRFRLLWSDCRRPPPWAVGYGAVSPSRRRRAARRRHDRHGAFKQDNRFEDNSNSWIKRSTTPHARARRAWDAKFAIGPGRTPAQDTTNPNHESPILARYRHASANPRHPPNRLSRSICNRGSPARIRTSNAKTKTWSVAITPPGIDGCWA